MGRGPVLAAAAAVLLVLLAGSRPGAAQVFEDTFASSGRSCGYPGYSYDMSKVEAAARQYPNGRVLILTPQEKTRLQKEFADWNSAGGRPMREMAPCFNCSPAYEACIVFERGGRPAEDVFASTGGGQQPRADDFASTGGGKPPAGQSDACRKNPQSYTCLYGHPGTGATSPAPLPGGSKSGGSKGGGSKGDGGKSGGGGKGGGGKGLARIDCAEAAAKGIVREGCEDPPAGTQPGGSAPAPAQLLAGIESCLRGSGITYYDGPELRPTAGTTRYSAGGGRIDYNPVYLARQSPYVAAFWLSEAYAAHVLNLEAQRFGVRRSGVDRVRARAYLGGYIVHCLQARGVLPSPGNLSPEDPRLQYADYLGAPLSLPGDPAGDVGRMEHWERGWREFGMGIAFSLRHDPQLPPTASDPYLP